MSRAVKRKEHPLSMRLPEADFVIIDRAATLRGRSRTDFVRVAAVRAAEDVLMETATIRMSPAGFKAFMEALSKSCRRSNCCNARRRGNPRMQTLRSERRQLV